jgi:hypothetical protein
VSCPADREGTSAAFYDTATRLGEGSICFLMLDRLAFLRWQADRADAEQLRALLPELEDWRRARLERARRERVALLYVEGLRTLAP